MGGFRAVAVAVPPPDSTAPLLAVGAVCRFSAALHLNASATAPTAGIGQLLFLFNFGANTEEPHSELRG